MAGKTAISTVGKEGVGLTYRGYAIEDLAQQATFEEVAYLLIYGQLPTHDELRDFRQRLVRLRELPEPLRDRVRTTAGRRPSHGRVADRLFGPRLPGAGAPLQRRAARSPTGCWPRFPGDHCSIGITSAAMAGGSIPQPDEPSLGRALPGIAPRRAAQDLHQRAMDISLILYAEHEFNASTFAARAVASTLSDFYSAITAAIGALRAGCTAGPTRRRWP